MARQLKTFLRNRKKEMLGCGPCECRTLQCWRYANENCGCGETTVNPKATWDSNYDGTTIPVGSMGQLGFTVIPEDFNYIVNLSNNNFQVLEITDEGAHHLVTLQAVRFVENDNSTVVTIEDWNGNVLASANIYTARNIETVSAPSENSISILQGERSNEITFTYTPADATTGLATDISDYSVAQIADLTFSNGTATVKFEGLSAGTATFTYWAGVDDSTKYTIDITVTPGR